MNRSEMIQRCQQGLVWDLIIIGGGATGLGSAVDAASRGLKVLLLEQSDFAKGTSSRSTKLLHGGLRYLKQGHISLVMEALHERGLLYRNAPHLVGSLPFLIPFYRWWEKWFYGIGLKLYDLLAGSLNLRPSRMLTKEEVLLHLPTLVSTHLRGGMIYYDGQFDDARLAISLARTAEGLGATVVNYMPVQGLLKERERIAGVIATDAETGRSYELKAKAVINATGVFVDQIRYLDDPSSAPLCSPSQGIHLVLDRSFLPSDTALLIPSTEDGRVLFLIPWHRHLLVGTTDTAVQAVELEPLPLEKEIEFLLRHIAHYLHRAPKRSDILSLYAGLRPLVKMAGKTNTASLARDHVVVVAQSGLITVTGGKWTTYRRMAQDVIDKAISIADLPVSACRTEALRLHGYQEGHHVVEAWTQYGSDAEELEELIRQHPDWGHNHLLHPRLPYLPVEVVWAVRKEMARSLEDVLARRTRALFLDAKAAVEIAPRVARLMAQELGKSAAWETKEVRAFTELAVQYNSVNELRM
ncbi:MAG: glycerol-3-phosphate dehydrogenase/oxidase [Chlamydiia bacterium]|nr:glycerol-3-phosphate dehydrogenase/oxidase [Chlamydiia bacterium]